MSDDIYVIGRAERVENGRRIRATIMYDPEPVNPREWDNLGTMVCFHKRYNLGDEPGSKHHFETPSQLLEFLEENGRMVFGASPARC